MSSTSFPFFLGGGAWFVISTKLGMLLINSKVSSGINNCMHFQENYLNMEGRKQNCTSRFRPCLCCIRLHVKIKIESCVLLLFTFFPIPSIPSSPHLIQHAYECMHVVECVLPSLIQFTWEGGLGRQALHPRGLALQESRFRVLI